MFQYLSVWKQYKQTEMRFMKTLREEEIVEMQTIILLFVLYDLSLTQREEYKS
jgi:hypothetical protein